MSLTIKDWGKMIGKMVCCYYDHKDYEPQYGIMSRLDLGDKYIIVDYEEYHIDYCKPILHRLINITKKDREFVLRNVYCKDCDKAILCVDSYGELCCKDVELVDYLDSKGYDIRGWIDQGLAIDAKTLEVK